jgi:hypothetical protein
VDFTEIALSLDLPNTLKPKHRPFADSLRKTQKIDNFNTGAFLPRSQLGDFC